jgi:hypothetical protein
LKIEIRSLVHSELKIQHTTYNTMIIQGAYIQLSFHSFHGHIVHGMAKGRGKQITFLVERMVMEGCPAL